MSLETGTYINSLVATNPLGSDPKSAGDDHIRLVKSTIKATFPNVAGAVTPTHTELNYVDGVTSAIQTQLDAKQTSGAELTAIAAGNISQAWPIGSVFISVVSTNPNTLLGGGTWVAFGAGRVLVGLDATQTEFDTVEETGGAKTHTLTTAEMPAHTHDSANAGGVSAGTAFNTWAFDGGAAASRASNSTGGGGAHNNLQPYIVCYFWKRTA